MKHPFVTPRNPLPWIIGSILLTYIGTFTEWVITGEFRAWHPLEFVYYVGVFAIAVGLAWKGIPPLLARTRVKHNDDENLRVEQLQPQKVLIVFVSNSATGGHSTIIKQLLKAPNTATRHLYLVYSTTSLGIAKTIAEDAETAPYTVYIDDLATNFSSLESCYGACLRVIGRALQHDDVEEEDIVVDMTGGTKMATAAVALASRVHRNLILAYSPPLPDGRPGTHVEQVVFVDATAGD